VNRKDLQLLIKTGEGFTLEFKERISSSLGKDICAFANASGGSILIGVNDQGKKIGYSLSNADKSKIQDIARNMDPSFMVEVDQVEDVVVISVDEGENKPYSVNGNFYVRIGANSQKLKRDEIRTFFQKQRLVVFDEKINESFSLKDDFNDAAFDEFIQRSTISNVISKNDLLKNLGFLHDGKMNNAGVLFFCEDVSLFFLNVNITCVLYQGDSKYKILDKKVFDCDLISNYENAVSYLKNKLNTEYVIKTEREEYLELPEDALREAVLNAIAHRDYFSTSHIQINIYKNSVEIINPASYPRNITIKDLLSGSHPRNLFLFSMMQRANLVEKVGSGIKRINDAMNEYKLDKPLIEYENIWFRIVFTRPDLQSNSYQQRRSDIKDVTVSVTVNDTQKKILNIMRKQPRITYDELAEMVNKSRRTVIRQVKNLREKGLVQRIGSDKSGHWKISR